MIDAGGTRFCFPCNGMAGGLTADGPYRVEAPADRRRHDERLRFPWHVIAITRRLGRNARATVRTSDGRLRDRLLS